VEEACGSVSFTTEDTEEDQEQTYL